MKIVNQDERSRHAWSTPRFLLLLLRLGIPTVQSLQRPIQGRQQLSKLCLSNHPILNRSRLYEHQKLTDRDMVRTDQDRKAMKQNIFFVDFKVTHFNNDVNRLIRREHKLPIGLKHNQHKPKQINLLPCYDLWNRMCSNQLK